MKNISTLKNIIIAASSLNYRNTLYTKGKELSIKVLYFGSTRKLANQI